MFPNLPTPTTSGLPTKRECLQEIIAGRSDEEEQAYILSVRASMRLLRTNPAFEKLRANVPEEVLVQYADDCDSVYSLFESYFKSEDEVNVDSGTPVFSESEKEELLEQAFAWQDVFLRETNQQARAFGLKIGFHLCEGQLIVGDQLVYTGPLQEKATMS